MIYGFIKITYKFNSFPIIILYQKRDFLIIVIKNKYNFWLVQQCNYMYSADKKYFAN